MKKLIIILSAWLILPNAYSQSTTTTTTTTTTPAAEPAPQSVSQDQDHHKSSSDFKKGYIGVRALATLSSLRVRNIDNSTVATDFIVGYGGGGVLGMNFNQHIGAQLELLYSALAQKYKDNSGITRKLNVSYVNVPLLLMLNTDASRGVNLNVCAGPQVGINTGSSVKTESENSSDAIDTVHAVLAVKTGDIGFAYGIGLDFLLGPSLKLSIGYRGVQGLVDISDNSKNATTNDYYILDRAHVNTYSGYAGLAVLF